jgi:hypothetical protein
MISFVKLSTEKDTIVDNVISEKGFTTFVRLIGWAIKSGNPCWAENCGAAVRVRNIIVNMDHEEARDVLKILAALPFTISGSQFRDDIDSISSTYDKEIFSVLFGADRRFDFSERNCLHSNATKVLAALRENLSKDSLATDIINNIQEEIKFRG